MKTVELPCFGMTFKVDANGGDMVRTELLREACPQCNNPDCNFDCDLSQVEFDGTSDPDAMEEEVLGRHKCNFALDVVEAYTLALLVSLERSGWDTAHIPLKHAIAEAVETAVDGLGNNV